MNAAGADGPSLDQLPMELVLEVASHLDLPSILRLEQVSSRYRDAAPLLRQQLRVLRVGERAGGRITSKELLELLPQLLGLRELQVRALSWRDLLEALVTASRHWPNLETLLVMNSPDIHQLLVQLCKNCSRLTDVTLHGNFSNRDMERIVAALPAVRAFGVHAFGALSGSFLPQLPAELRHLTVACTTLTLRAKVIELRRYGQLRSLKLSCRVQAVAPAHLAAGLSGCGQLCSLTVDASALSQQCLSNLPQLRHLDVIGPVQTDTELNSLLSMLPSVTPGLESLSLSDWLRLTPEGLAMGMRTLSSLPSLRSLKLTGIPSVCDRALTELRSHSLQQLYLSGPILMWLHYRCSLTATGLLAGVNNCGSLETLTLCVGTREERIACHSGARERGLLEKIQAAIDLEVQQSRDTSPDSQTEHAHKRRKNSD